MTVVLICMCLAAYAVWPRPLAVDIHRDLELMVDAVTRTYRLVLPHDLPASAPIVFAFHGKGDSPESMATYSQLDRLADDERFILIYPEGMNGDWEISSREDSDKLNQDIDYFDKLLDYISDKHSVDRNRVYVVGFSNGASFARLLSYARPEKIAAVVAHSGPHNPNLSPPSNAPPLMMLVGEEDFFAGAVKSDAEAIRQAGQVVEFISIPSLDHRWSVSHNAEIWQFLLQWSTGE